MGKAGCYRWRGGDPLRLAFEGGKMSKKFLTEDQLDPGPYGIEPWMRSLPYPYGKPEEEWNGKPKKEGFDFMPWALGIGAIIVLSYLLSRRS